MLVRAIFGAIVLISAVNGLLNECKYHEFDCDTHSKCIPFAKHCDGIEDCKVSPSMFITKAFKY